MRLHYALEDLPCSCRPTTTTEGRELALLKRAPLKSVVMTSFLGIRHDSYEDDSRLSSQNGVQGTSTGAVTKLEGSLAVK
jgi:hypothetical protein